MLQNVNANEATDVFQTLGFTARSVAVENFSNSWIWIEPARKFVAPWRAQTIELSQPTDQAQITWRNPPLVPVAPTRQGQAFTYWSSASAPTSQAVTLFTGQGQVNPIDTGGGAQSGSTTRQYHDIDNVAITAGSQVTIIAQSGTTTIQVFAYSLLVFSTAVGTGVFTGLGGPSPNYLRVADANQSGVGSVGKVYWRELGSENKWVVPSGQDLGFIADANPPTTSPITINGTLEFNYV